MRRFTLGQVAWRLGVSQRQYRDLQAGAVSRPGRVGACESCTAGRRASWVAKLEWPPGKHYLDALDADAGRTLLGILTFPAERRQR